LKVWEPSVSGPYEAGLVQLPYASESTAHWKVAVASVSENEKLALAEALTLGGFDVMVGVAGAVVSTVQV
jgi:hypothetical protein